jgi:GTP-binding protein Era
VPPGSGDRFVQELMRAARVPAVLALNKVDRVRKPDLLPRIAESARTGNFRAVVPISALTGDGVDRLEREILDALPEGDALYPDEYLTDQTERSLAAELIREKVLRYTRDELPYTTAVLIERFEEPEQAGGLTRIYASILVDHASQKPIVVGRGGEMIKRIGTDARQDLEAMLGGRVFLDLHVKVREDWRDDERTLDEMGLKRR